MKSKFSLLLLIFSLFLFVIPVKAQEDESKDDSTKVKASLLVGAVTADGKNYQQFGLRTDIPIGKLGFGVDIQILIDKDGKIRKQDWDNWQAYLDKIYYIRWAHKNDPFYIKVGGLDYSYLGYSNIVNGYSNMIEYPTVKKYGMEMAFYAGGEDDEGNTKKRFGGEFIINNFKELAMDKPGMLVGGRLFVVPVWKLQIGATFATDLNEYNSLPDRDKDGIPDQIDQYADDKNFAAQYDYWLNQPGSTAAFVNQAVALGMIDGTRKINMFNKTKVSSQSMVYGIDMGIPLVSSDMFKFDIYAHISSISGKDSVGNSKTYGWGLGAPGARIIIGESNFLTLNLEYRKSSKEFLFGYYDYTYELQRSTFVKDGTGKLAVKTKQQSLTDIKDGMNGIYGSMTFNFFGLIGMTAGYQDLILENSISGMPKLHKRSIKGELNLGETLKSKLPIKDLKAYYVQNNVQDFKTWKSPSAIMGALIGYDFKGAVIGLDYRLTFQDLNGDGKIGGSNETIKTIGMRTSVSF